MKFSYAIGNPPYQEQKGGTKNVDIWPEFVKESTKIADTSCMIHPGRWVIPKKYMKNVQLSLLSLGMTNFNYFPNSNDVFGNVSVDGGISITLFKSDSNGDTHYSISGENKGIFNPDEKIFSNKFEEETYIKVFTSIKTNMEAYRYGRMAFDGGQYGYDKKINRDKVFDKPDGMRHPIKVWCSIEFGKGESEYKWRYIDKTDLLDFPEEKLFSSKKVMIDSKGHAIAHGKGNVINNLPVICDRETTAGPGVYWFFPKHEIERELQLIKSLFITKTARYLMCITQKSLCVAGFENIPDYLELAKLLPEDELFTDDWFYKTFDFSEGLINEIETRVSSKVNKEV